MLGTLNPSFGMLPEIPKYSGTQRPQSSRDRLANASFRNDSPATSQTLGWDKYFASNYPSTFELFYQARVYEGSSGLSSCRRFGVVMGLQPALAAGKERVWSLDNRRDASTTLKAGEKFSVTSFLSSLPRMEIPVALSDRDSGPVGARAEHAEQS